METDPILQEVYRMKDGLRRKTRGDAGKLFDLLHTFAAEHPQRMVNLQQVRQAAASKRKRAEP